MDMLEVKSFNAELSGLYENRPPISKAKMSAITKGAIKAIKFYKHVVHSVEKFIQKCKPEYKVPGLYVIDSIVRQSRHQFGQDKDVFAPRFAKNMQQTFANLFRCPDDDKRNIIRVLNLWQKNNVFSPEVIQPLLDMADPNHPLHMEIMQQQNNTANGSSFNVSHNTSDNKMSPMPRQDSPHTSSPMGDAFQDDSSNPPPAKFNRKLLNDFEYESEDEQTSEPPPQHNTHPAHSTHSTHSTHTTHTSHNTHNNPTDALGSILTNPEIMRQLQSLQAQMQLMTGMQIPNLMPMMSDMQLQQNQNQNLPFLNSQPEQQKQNESKDDMANESDIEFVETGPQVIEIPDANDSRSPSPKRRHRSRSKSPRRRRRSRSRSPRRRRDRDRDRDREREKDREKSHKEREAEKEKQREREKKGLPPIKKDNLSVCSTTLWVGHLSKLATQEELSDLFGAFGGVVSIDVVAPRGCAFVVMERRRDAAKALAKLNKHKLHSKEITVAWAAGKGVKGREWKDHWEAELGVAYLPWAALHARWLLGALSLDALEDGGAVDEDTLPPWLPPRMIPKALPDGMSMMAGGPAALLAGLPPGMPPPAGMPLPGPSLPAGLPMPMPRMPPPGMAGLPPGLAPGVPSIRPPVPGLPREGGLPPGGALLGFPPQTGMVGGFLSGLMGVGMNVGGLVLPHSHTVLHAHAHAPPAPLPHALAAPDDAMDLDPDEHEEPPLAMDQLQALLSKPPPSFNSSEPPPGFKPQEQPAFDSTQPPPDEKREEDRRDRDGKDRRDRDRDRDRERRDRDRRDTRERDRRDRDRGRDRDREKDDRRERDRDRGRERRDRDRDRERERDRFGARDPAREISRDKSPRSQANDQNPEKSLQERLWEMANGKPGDVSDEAPPEPDVRDRPALLERPPRIEGLPLEANGAVGASQVPRPPFAPDLRMRGPPARQPMRGPWMDVQGPGPGPFGPRFNGMGPLFNRPPFERPPFEGGPPMFERPPFNRMPFDGNRPPFDGSRPPFDGPRPPFDVSRQFDGPRLPFDGPRPPFDGPRPPFDGPRPPFDGPRPPFDGTRPPFDGPRPPFDGPRPSFDGPRPPFDGPRPPFDGPRPSFDRPRPPFDGPRPPFDGPRQYDGFDGDRPFDVPRFEGPPEYYDRGNRRFDEREQCNDRVWPGDRERDWDRRNEWDDRRRDRRSREHEDRFRDRNERRRNFEERPRQSKEPEKNPRKEKDRKSRWGVAEEGMSQSDEQDHVSEDKVDEPSSDIDQPQTSNDEKDINDIINPSQDNESVQDNSGSESNKEVPEPKVEVNDKYDPAENETEEDQNEQEISQKEMEEISLDLPIPPPEAETNQAPSDLYDENEAIDTSFAITTPHVISPPQNLDEKSNHEHEESSKSEDIFDQERKVTPAPEEAEVKEDAKDDSV